MITGLGLENFKAWRKLEKIRMAPLTGFFGANSSGKSSIIQFLLLLKQTINFADPQAVLYFGDERDTASFVELESYENIVFNHDLQRLISWTLDWKREFREADSPKTLHTELQANSENYPIVNEIDYTYSNVVHRIVRDANTSEYKLLYRSDDETEEEIPLEPDTVDYKSGWSPKKCYGFPPSAYRISFQMFTRDIERLFESIFYLGPMREFPRRHYRWDGSNPYDVGSRGERVVDAILTARRTAPHIIPKFLQTSKRGEEPPSFEYHTFEQRIAQWLKALNLIHDFKMEQIGGSNLYQVLVQRTPKSVFVPLPDVGFGVSQILPVLVLCFYAPEHSTIILEHPELHLHPSVQMGLADVLIEAIQTRHIQIILESHSEHLLNRIQRRMAEASLTKEEVALYFCDMDEDGAAKMEELKLNEYGEISNYPPDFFGDRFGEAATTQLEALRRRRAAKK